MPQLKKVALAMGDRLAYADTYEQALSQLIGETMPGEGENISAPSGITPTQQAPAQQPSAISRQNETLQQLKNHFQRYRDLNSQGKYAEAGRELEAIQKILNQ
jgi:hypothetical protein